MRHDGQTEKLGNKLANSYVFCLRLFVFIFTGLFSVVPFVWHVFSILEQNIYNAVHNVRIFNGYGVRRVIRNAFVCNFMKIWRDRLTFTLMKPSKMHWICQLRHSLDARLIFEFSIPSGSWKENNENCTLSPIRKRVRLFLARKWNLLEVGG